MKPRITVQLTAWCDGCMHWEFLESKTKLKGLTEILNKGWKYYNGRYICPNCVLNRIKPKL